MVDISCLVASVSTAARSLGTATATTEQQLLDALLNGHPACVSKWHILFAAERASLTTPLHASSLATQGLHARPRGQLGDKV